MSEPPKKYCIFGCDALVAHGVPQHRFPNPEKRRDLFTAWVLPEVVLVGQQSIPTINLNRVQQSLLTFVEIDHSSSCPRRE
ncbi:unnamed protein product, partial [Iphiclides podalirius]